LQVSEQTYSDIVKFLYKEAELQDLRRNREWLALWTEDSTYHMPIRVTKEKEVSGILERKQGEETDFAWAENPPSRSKHFISNIRVEPGEKEDEVKIKSYVLLTTHRGDDLNYDMLTYERLDVLRRVGNEWKIASRTVIPDQSRLTVDRISVFL
jgi:3-phenylpropionate/cinnamic acid dioxygenase small subunit